MKIIYIKHRNFSPKKKIWIFLGGGKKPKKPFGFFKKKTNWFKPWFKPRLKPFGLNHANPTAQSLVGPRTDSLTALLGTFGAAAGFPSHNTAWSVCLV